MRNVLAIAKKEINVYFTTPVAYIVFAFVSLVASYFFIGAINSFTEASRVAMQMPKSDEQIFVSMFAAYVGINPNDIDWLVHQGDHWGCHRSSRLL